jgi:hypothetical protein
MTPVVVAELGLVTAVTAPAVVPGLRPTAAVVGAGLHMAGLAAPVVTRLGLTTTSVVARLHMTRLAAPVVTRLSLTTTSVVTRLGLTTTSVVTRLDVTRPAAMVVTGVGPAAPVVVAGRDLENVAVRPQERSGGAAPCRAIVPGAVVAPGGERIGGGPAGQDQDGRGGQDGCLSHGCTFRGVLLYPSDRGRATIGRWY